jgi:spermidine synthase
VDRGPERRLIIAGEIQSVYFPGGDWSGAEREYWARALAPTRAVARPRALLIGLGGGTQIHLLRRQAPGGVITVVERDPAVVRVALDWFGLREVGGLEVLCADAEHAVTLLALARRRFDYVMDDISYAATPDDAVRLARRLAPLVAPTGTLVLNQHRRAAAQAVAEAISGWLPRVRLVRVRRGAENVLIFAERADGAGTLRARARGTTG